MSFWKSARDKLAVSRAFDEAVHAAALAEFESGQRRDGLWAKALISTQGDTPRTQAAYLALLVGALRDELYLERRAAQLADQAKMSSKPHVIEHTPYALPEHALAAQLAISGRASYKHYEVLITQAGGTLKPAGGFFQSHYEVCFAGARVTLKSFEELARWANQNLPLAALAGHS